MSIMEAKAMDVDTPTKEEFKTWREALGWSRREAARMLQYTNASAISQIELGMRKVPRRVAVMMKLYELTVAPNVGEPDEGNTASKS